ncbi:HisA/HisF-related TIM barrel protein [Streptomyces sp. NPDC002952]|uniref:HisA/HisF-related TIM barrel protein n=1 Tax=Streptomyces sp. NPDC002952 TaxID=3364673 RepID=UPI0036CC4432
MANQSALNGGIPIGSLMVCVVLTERGEMATETAVPGLEGSTDPVQMAWHYQNAGAQVMFVDVWNSWDNLVAICESVRELSKTGLSLVVSIDNGLIRSVPEIRRVLDAGAFAVTVNTTAVDQPDLVRAVAEELGSERLVCVVNVTTADDGTRDVRVDGGVRSTGKEPVTWSAEVAALGVGSVVINDMDREKHGGGFNLPLLKSVVQAVDIPVICGGGSRSPRDLIPAFAEGAHSVLVLTQLHDAIHTTSELLEVLPRA